MKVASPAALARVLRARLSESGDPDRAITLSELIHDVLPYARVRSELGLAGKAEYDLALLSLLKRRDLVEVDPVVIEAVERESELPEPSLDFARGIENSWLRLAEGTPGPPVTESRFSLEPEIPVRNGDDKLASARHEAVVDADAVTDGPIVEDRRPTVEEETRGRAEPEPGSASGRDLDPARNLDEVTHPREVTDSDAGAGAEPPGDPEPAGPAPTGERNQRFARTESLDPGMFAGGASESAVRRSDDGLVRNATRAAAVEPWAAENAAAPACAACHARHPDLPLVRFCPHCGAFQLEGRCGGCGAPVEDDWRYCAGCGSKLGAA